MDFNPQYMQLSPLFNSRNNAIDDFGYTPPGSGSYASCKLRQTTCAIKPEKIHKKIGCHITINIIIKYTSTNNILFYYEARPVFSPAAGLNVPTIKNNNDNNNKLSTLVIPNHRQSGHRHSINDPSIHKYLLSLIPI